MKKILFLLLMLCCVTAVWAGSGTGSKKDPYIGEWQASQLIPQLKEGNHLAYECIINSGSRNVGIYVFDDKIGNIKIIGLSGGWESWGVGYAISPEEPLATDYQGYYSFNTPEVRKTQTFVVTKAEYRDATTIYITGHYSGHYDRGDGTKENPYWGEWSIDELYKKLDDGVHLALDCDIKGNADHYISVQDTRLSREVASKWEAWSPGNFIGDTTPGGYYAQYGKDNPFDNRKEQTFVVTDKDFRNGTYPTFTIIGHFSGFYTTPDAQGFVHVESAEQMKIILGGNDNVKANDHAKIRLTEDIYLSDINKDYELYCETFYGTIDGNGHTIKGDPKADVRARTYLFHYSEGATFKNLTFKGIRVNSQSNSNQAIITSQAKNGCVFENITFDNIHSFSNYNNVGAAAGYAYDCTFTNIKVKNSDFTVDDNYVGSVVGDADKCTFTNIEITNCKTYAHDDCAGGIVGHSRNCKFEDVDVKNSFFQVDGCYVGGVAGKSIEGSQFTNCVVDDQSCVCSDGTYLVGALAGGITGFSDNCEFYDCINSALIACNDELVGGIIGQAINNTFVYGCLNTGMLVFMKTDEVNNSYYNKYKTLSGMTGVTKTYNGKEYLIRRVDDRKGDVSAYGGIVGYMINCTISRCANLGTLTTEHSCGGIVGIAESEYIRDCLVDFHGTNLGVIGIAGLVWNAKTTIAYSLNISPFGYYCCWDGTCYADNVVDHPSEAEQKFGVACAKLGENWQQNIGTDPYPTPTGNKGVYHTRKVTSQYGTACLPFALKSDDKISYYTLSGREDDEQGIKLVFTYLDEVMPGSPVLFRAEEAKDADTDNPVEICFNNAGEEFTTSPTNKIFDAGFWDFWGTFEQRVFENELAKNIYYVSGGEIRNAKKVTIAPYRAWIYGENIDDLTGNGASQAKAIRFVLKDEDGTTTALQLVGDDLREMQNVYNLAGQKANENYRGIVIKNGNKILKK